MMKFRKEKRKDFNYQILSREQKRWTTKKGKNDRMTVQTIYHQLYDEQFVDFY